MTERLKFYYVGVNNYKLFFIAAFSEKLAVAKVRSLIPWYQRWRSIRAKEDKDPVQLSDRGYEMKLTMVDHAV